MSWGAGSPKNGTPVSPTTVQALVENSTPGHYEFATGSVRPCLISNHSGKTVFININDSSYGAPSVTSHHVAVVNGTTTDLSFGGAINVKFLTLISEASAVEENIEINGWRTGD